MVCHHLAKFSGPRYCSSRDMMLLVCHVIKRENRVIKGSVDYKEFLKVSFSPPCQGWWS